MTELPLIGGATAVAADARLADAKIGVVTFPGTLDDRDAARAIRLAGGTAVELWHGDSQLGDVDAVVARASGEGSAFSSSLPLGVSGSAPRTGT